MSAIPPYDGSIVGLSFFIEDGTVISGQTISASVEPADAAFADYSMGDVLEFNPDSKVVSRTRLIGQTDGEWYEQQREKTVSEFADMVTADMRDFFFRLQYGLPSKIELGTAQVPGGNSDRKITGWWLFQARAEGGVDLWIHKWRCEMRLNTKAKFKGADLPVPALRMFKLPHNSNSIVFPD